jgi:ATP-binding cassette subfamily B protein
LQAITFDNVAFDYGRERVIESASFAINKGEIVCLTGASGSGKSTVFKLLLSLYAPSEGEISLQSKDEKTPLTAANRNLFAYVPQGNFLFSGTILENLTFFSKRTDEDEEQLLSRVKRAIDVACAEFVWELPQGLQTPLYEGGKGLSEGQMQRLAVARAILSDRPILLLDEATSALDAQTEKQLLQNVRTLQNKTCVIVTHRPAALEIADSVLHVEKATVSKQ